MQREVKTKEIKKQKKKNEWIASAQAVVRNAAAAFVREIVQVRDGIDVVWRTHCQGVKIRKSIAVSVLFCAVFVLSGIIASATFPLGVTPGGFALLSAIGTGRAFRRRFSAERKLAKVETALVLTAFSGVLVSAVFREKYALVYLISYLILFFIRAALTGARFSESILTRVTLSATSATATGLLTAALDGFLTNRLFAAVSLSVLTPLLTYLISGAAIYYSAESVGERAPVRRRVYLQASILTVCYLVLYALRDLRPANFSLSFLLAVILTLSAAKWRGALAGAACGMIGQMACGMTSLAPALAVGGFFAGLFFSYSNAAALMISFVTAGGYSMFAEGFESFGQLTIDYLCGAILFLPLVYGFRDNTAEENQAVVPTAEKNAVDGARERLKDLSDAFSSLSEVFYTVSDTMKKPKLNEVSRLVSDACSEVCSSCERSRLCWGREKELTGETTVQIAARLITSGEIKTEDLPDAFCERCHRREALVALIRKRFADLNGSYYQNHKTRLLAGEYSAVSRLMKSTAGEIGQRLERDPEAEETAKRVLASLGIGARRVAVFGKREKKIDAYGVALEKVELSSNALVAAFEEAFDCVFDDPRFVMMEDSVVLRLVRRRRFTLECSKAGCAKRGETVSGDAAVFFESDSDRFYSLICDGMGSGREAAFAGRLAAIFIEKLMLCATPKNVTLELLNSFLMSKSDETFSTVDLLEVDLMSGEANFMKAGAAPSFVLRGETLHRIESRTPPAGILSRMCAEQTSFLLRDGDYIIQISDGALKEHSDRWLLGVLSSETFHSAAELSQRLFEAAGERLDYSDDLSISVSKVMNAR